MNTLDEEQKLILRQMSGHAALDTSSVALVMGCSMLEPEDRAHFRARLNTLKKHGLVKKRGRAWSLTDAGISILRDER